MNRLASYGPSAELAGELLTGLPDLDAQHRYFRRLVENATRLGHKNDQYAYALVLEVARYAQCHFAYEETMMAVYDYPDMAHHVEAHQLVMATLKRTLDGGSLDTARMKITLLEWLSTHVPLDDVPLAHFVAKLRPSFNELRP